MPRYDFKCRECNQIFEALVPHTLSVLPCICCNNNNPLITSLGQALADRLLCFPSRIHIH